MFQHRLDTEVGADNAMFLRNRHDWMDHPGQRGDDDGAGDRRGGG